MRFRDGNHDTRMVREQAEQRRESGQEYGDGEGHHQTDPAGVN